ncbi:hypothetical protein C8R44DRAFT_773556 [Mycena epipterygia]|nr:hypothetical protein C8R44DRAFT_773556 [Mycena epipterygia]
MWAAFHPRAEGGRSRRRPACLHTGMADAAWMCFNDGARRWKKHALQVAAPGHYMCSRSPSAPGNITRHSQSHPGTSSPERGL